jgi:hypothetical protein
MKQNNALSTLLMEQGSLKNVNNCLNTNIYSYLETSGGKSYNLYLNVVQFFNTNVNRTMRFKNGNNCLNANINSYLETSGGKSYNLYLNVVHFFNTSVD